MNEEIEARTTTLAHRVTSELEPKYAVTVAAKILASVSEESDAEEHFIQECARVSTARSTLVNGLLRTIRLKHRAILASIEMNRPRPPYQSGDRLSEQPGVISALHDKLAWCEQANADEAPSDEWTYFLELLSVVDGLIRIQQIDVDPSHLGKLVIVDRASERHVESKQWTALHSMWKAGYLMLEPSGALKCTEMALAYIFEVVRRRPDHGSR